MHNGIDSQLWQRSPDERRRPQARHRPRQTVGRSSSAGSPGRRGCPTCCAPRRRCRPDVQLVLCAGRAGHRGDHGRGRGADERAQAKRGDGVIWIPEMLPRNEVVALLSAATVFVCPSVYEPLGIVNLEAMACELAVVATATGGIPEVVVDGETGWLVPIEQVDDGTGTPVDPDAFVADLAGRLTEAVSDQHRAAALRPGRTHARRRALLVGVDRRPHHGGLPPGPRLTLPAARSAAWLRRQPVARPADRRAAPDAGVIRQRDRAPAGSSITARFVARRAGRPPSAANGARPHVARTSTRRATGSPRAGDPRRR